METDLDLYKWSNRSQSSKGGTVLHGMSSNLGHIKKSCGCYMGDRRCQHGKLPHDIPPKPKYIRKRRTDMI